MKKIILGLILTISLNAEWVAGNKLVNFMKEAKKANAEASNIDYIEANKFKYYLLGVIDTIESAGHTCIPNNVTQGQLMAIVIKYIDNNPDKWNESANKLVWTPLIDKFPCKKQ